MTTPMIYSADLFCGSGGTSTGLMQAAEELGVGVKLVAVNHWQTAIETHTSNHPGVTHYCEDLETVNPRHAVPGGHLHLLVASPECTHHSNARGGKPMSDQSRASVWHVLRWAEALYIDHILIENVKEFRDWGPLHGCTCGLGDGSDIVGPHQKACRMGRPIVAMKGRLYQQFLGSLRALGYTVAERVLNAADFGDATTRQRLFIQARRGTKRPTWPTPTHMKPAPADGLPGLPGLLDGIPTWRSAREIIDWSLASNSIYTRKRPLAPATMARIFAGLRKYSGLPFIVPQFGEAEKQSPRSHSLESPLPTVMSHGAGALVEPFLVVFRNHQDAASLSRPLPTMTTMGANFALAEPFIVPNRTNGTAHSLGDPLRTLTTGDNMILCQPFVIGQQSCAAPRTTDNPLPTVATAGAISLVEPFIIRYYSERPTQEKYTGGLDQPLHTITGRGAGALIEAEVQPFIVPTTHGGGEERSHDVDLPLPTVTTAHRGELAICEPFLTEFHGGRDSDKRTRSLDDPICTLDTSNRVGLAEPFLVSYYGNGQAVSVDEPLDTITARDRFALIDPRLVTDGMVDKGLVDKGLVVGWLDIRFRMLQPHELAAAMSFPQDYQFSGNREAKVKQIGNSVAVGTAKALCLSILKEYVHGLRSAKSC